MTVEEIMTRNVRVCAPEQDLRVAASIMLDGDCGFVPVVDSHGTVVGVITDRDICRIAARAHRTLEHIQAREAMSHPVYASLPDENVKAALVTMAGHRVRRLPVLDKAGRLRGVLSVDDVVRAPRASGSPTSDQIVEAFKAICAPRSIEPASA